MPDDTDQTISRLQAVADWMRENGVLGLRLYDGTELRLDPQWRPHADTIPAPADPELTPDQKMKELVELRASTERRPFRHVRLTRTPESRHAPKHE